MNYDIKIAGAPVDNGSISFSRMEQLTRTTGAIVARAMALKIFGYSDVKIPGLWTQAQDIQLEKVFGDQTAGTNLLVNCEPLSGKIKAFQVDMYKQDLWKELQQVTPMTLLISAFNTALTESGDRNQLDKPLLKALIQFKKNFVSDQETISLSNRQSIPGIEIRKSDFKKIELLEDSIPEPNKVSVFGKVEELKHSKRSVVLMTDGKRINAFAKDDDILDGIKEYFGQELVITGMAHYRPGGVLSYLVIQSYRKPDEADPNLEREPSAMTAEQQLLFQIKKKGLINPLASIVGEWPGDESIEDILESID